MMADQDWELYVARTDGTGEHRFTGKSSTTVPRFLGGRFSG